MWAAGLATSRSPTVLPGPASQPSLVSMTRWRVDGTALLPLQRAQRLPVGLPSVSLRSKEAWPSECSENHSTIVIAIASRSAGAYNRRPQRVRRASSIAGLRSGNSLGANRPLRQDWSDEARAVVAA